MFEALDRDVFRGGVQVRREVRFEDAQGQPIWYEAVFSPLLSDQGKPILVGIARDITDRKRLEIELLEAQQLLEERIAERTAELARANQELEREVQQRRQAEAAIRESESLLRSFFDSRAGCGESSKWWRGTLFTSRTTP